MSFISDFLTGAAIGAIDHYGPGLSTSNPEASYVLGGISSALKPPPPSPESQPGGTPFPGVTPRGGQEAWNQTMGGDSQTRMADVKGVQQLLMEIRDALERKKRGEENPYEPYLNKESSSDYSFPSIVESNLTPY